LIISVPTAELKICTEVPSVVSVPVPVMYANNVHELIIERAVVVELARGPPLAALNYG
jgi:hypothetical protein